MASPQQPPPPPPPTLRVMRLYRPSAPRPGSAALILPESFGNIYAGEPFVAYVAVTNGGPAALRDVLVTAKLQAPSAKRAVDLPDTFASMTAATSEPHADNSLGNITGSNSVNVFLGLGLPWAAASLYWVRHRMHRTEDLACMPSDGLSGSLSCADRPSPPPPPRPPGARAIRASRGTLRPCPLASRCRRATWASAWASSAVTTRCGSSPLD